MTHPQPGAPGGGKPTALIAGAVAAVLVVVAAVVVAVTVPGRGNVEGVALAADAPTTSRRTTPRTTPRTTRPSATASGGATKACAYQATSGAENKDVGEPDNAGQVPTTGTVTVTVKTSDGDIPITLDRGKAPCAVHSTLFLVEKKFYDSGSCHRLTSAATLKVLQCGDPTGTGAGGPAYGYATEEPTGLPPSGQGTVVYPAGIVAMANKGPGTDSNGSQFFLVYADSTLPASYAVLGTFDTTGKETVGKITARGTQDGGDDGRPKTPVSISTVTTG